jgi:hypothetical protein
VVFTLRQVLLECPIQRTCKIQKGPLPRRRCCFLLSRPCGEDPPREDNLGEKCDESREPHRYDNITMRTSYTNSKTPVTDNKHMNSEQTRKKSRIR